MEYKNRLAAIRQQMKQNGVSAYIIASADPHMSEYVPDHYKCIKFASGFTGSAGTLVVTETFAGLWTDARYFEQATEQLKDSGFELVKLKVQHAPEYIDWLYEKLGTNAVVAFDFNLYSLLLGESLQSKLADKNISLKNFDFLSALWTDRPALPTTPAYLIDPVATGETTSEKLTRVRASLKKYNAAYHLISSLDDLAWLFNIRGKDVSYNPVVLSFALVNTDSATLFIDLNKLSGKEKNELKDSGVAVLTYENVGEKLKEIPANSSIFIDAKRNCYGLRLLLNDTVKVVQDINPTTHFKSIKNQAEIENTRAAMIKDGVAMTRFFKWIRENIGKIKITELSASEQLKDFRAGLDTFDGVSFNTIGGYRAHGALPHYMATEESDSELKAEGLYLVDSGGQYFYGTTDITRMVSLGNNTDEESTDYTLVLKALIEGSSTYFPKGTRGYQIDAICRKPLWDYKINYGHGTGHGVGFYLNVHEGPQVINPTNVPVDMELGMITSIEPGIYRPGKHGVRIENLVLTIKDETNQFEEFYAFETLTLALIETNLVKKELLEASHIKWLNNYNQMVFERLQPHLSADEAAWLNEQCKSI